MIDFIKKMWNHKVRIIPLSFSKALHQYISYGTDDDDLAIEFWNLTVTWTSPSTSCSAGEGLELHVPYIWGTEMTFLLYTSENTRNAQESETGSNSASQCQNSFGTPLTQEDGKHQYTSVQLDTINRIVIMQRTQPLVTQQKHSLATHWCPCTIKNGNCYMWAAKISTKSNPN